MSVKQLGIFPSLLWKMVLPVENIITRLKILTFLWPITTQVKVISNKQCGNIAVIVAVNLCYYQKGFDKGPHLGRTCISSKFQGFKVKAILILTQIDYCG